MTSNPQYEHPEAKLLAQLEECGRQSSMIATWSTTRSSAFIGTRFGGAPQARTNDSTGHTHHSAGGGFETRSTQPKQPTHSLQEASISASPDMAAMVIHGRACGQGARAASAATAGKPIISRQAERQAAGFPRG
jgi:hypothetical protein